MIEDLFTGSMEPTAWTATPVDRLDLPALVATIDPADYTDLGLNHSIPHTPQMDRSPGAVVRAVAERMLRAVNRRQPADEQYDTDSRIFPDFKNPDLLRSVNDLCANAERFRDELDDLNPTLRHFTQRD